jgi:hypothetical protein
LRFYANFFLLIGQFMTRTTGLLNDQDPAGAAEGAAAGRPPSARMVVWKSVPVTGS